MDQSVQGWGYRGRERKGRKDSQAAVGIKHCEYTREAITGNCYKGGVVDRDSVRVGREQAQENEACAEMVKEQTSTGDDEVGGRKTLQGKEKHKGPGVDAQTLQPSNINTSPNTAAVNWFTSLCIQFLNCVKVQLYQPDQGRNND